MEQVAVETTRQTEWVEITAKVQGLVSAGAITEGLCTVYVPHTTAGVTINENADPTVVSDFLNQINKVIPFDDSYRHGEGNAAAHIKSVLTGPSVSIPIADGRLQLGRWQGIFFCEYDGPRSRRALVQITA